MDEFRFVPLDRVEVVPAQVESVVGLVRDAPRLARADAVVLVREEAGAPAPYYYVLGNEELDASAQLYREPPRRPDARRSLRPTRRP